MQNEAMVIDENELRKLLKAKCDKAGSQRAYAETHGLCETMISRVIRGERGFTDEILEALKVQEVQYKVPFMKFEDVE